MCKIKNIAYFYVCKFLIPKSSLITRINYNPCVQAVHAVVLVHFRCYVPLGVVHTQSNKHSGLCYNKYVHNHCTTYVLIEQGSIHCTKNCYKVFALHKPEYFQRDIFTIFTNWIQFVNNYPPKTLSGLHKCKDQVHSRTFLS